MERFGGNPDELTSFYVVANFRTDRARLLSRGRAALFVAGELGWPWKAAACCAWFPRRSWTACTTSSLETDIACSAASTSA